MKFQSSLRNLRRGSGQAAPTFRTHAEAGQFIGVQPVPSGRLKAGAWVPAPLSDGNRRHHGAGRAYLFPDGRGGCVVNWVTGERAFWFDDYGRPRAAVDGAIMLATRRPTGRERSGLHSQRRMTAAPSHVRDTAISFVVRTHGLIAPALYRFCGLMPCGNPSGLPFPLTRSANPHGVAHPHSGGERLSETPLGAHHE